MKVTSFEISKKLAEIGFEAETHLYWKNSTLLEYHISFDFPAPTTFVPAYDLETILEALPKEVAHKEKIGNLGINFLGNQGFLFYEDSNNLGIDIGDNLSLNQIAEQSLVDTAARLLILLFEKGLIKFE